MEGVTDLKIYMFEGTYPNYWTGFSILRVRQSNNFSILSQFTRNVGLSNAIFGSRRSC